MNTYEIYTYNKHPITEGPYSGAKAGTVSGWEIVHVASTDDRINSFPFFDCIISKNDTPTGSNAINW